MNGGYIIQRVDENLTYDYLHSSEENLWSLMYLTGYLTQVRDYKIDDGWQDNMVALKIPNLEIKQIFETEVSKWFEDSSKNGIERNCFHLYGVKIAIKSQKK